MRRDAQHRPSRYLLMNDRCSRCGDTLIADGTEEADWATMCPDCDEEYRAELNGDQSEPLAGLEDWDGKK